MFSTTAAAKTPVSSSRPPLHPVPTSGMAAGNEHAANENAKHVDFSKVRIVSGEGEIAANPEQKKLLCYVADGRLFVAEGKKHDMQVLSYTASLNRRGKKFTMVEVDMATIAKLYSAGAGASSRPSDSTRMMDDAKKLIEAAASRRASDIHIRTGDYAEIYYRIHGDLVKVGTEAVDYGKRLLRTFYQAMADVSDETFKENARLDARIASREKLPDNIHGVRISTTPTDKGNLMVLRLLYNDTEDSIDLRHLGFSETQYELMRLMNEQPIGMNIICGPTGSGKSTTLQRVLRWQIVEAHGRRHVITVEDPPEYPIEGAVQTPVTNADNENERSRLFSEAIANAMRLDPDTIMIGEIRDTASARMALRAAMTGHQVWTTLHANSAMAIIDRLLDLDLPMEMLTDHSLVTGLIAQRLVKVLCPKCKRRLIDHTDAISASLMDRLKRSIGADWTNVCVSGGGCDHCKDTGFIGRTVVCEVIIPDPKFMDFLRKKDKIGARDHWLNYQRGRTFVAHALDKIKRGEVDPETAERIVGRLNMDELLGDSVLTMQEIASGAPAD